MYTLVKKIAVHHAGLLLDSGVALCWLYKSRLEKVEKASSRLIFIQSSEEDVKRSEEHNAMWAQPVLSHSPGEKDHFLRSYFHPAKNQPLLYHYLFPLYLLS